jgi:hypothetical protein
METREITQKYRQDRNLSFREFASEVNAELINTGFSYSTAYRLETKNYEPELSLLIECIVTYRNTPRHWIAQWAVEMFSAMYPDLIQSGVVTFRLNHKETIQP